MNFKVIKQIPASQISGSVMSIVSSERRKLMFSLLMDSDIGKKGHMVSFDNNYIVKIMDDPIKQEDGYMYVFQPPSFDEFDYNKHIPKDMTLQILFTKYNE